jgi:flagellar biosynthesis/type III secretory pathway chaperone
MQATDLKDLTHRLLDILGNEITIGRALLAALRAEKSALIESKAELLSASTAAKEDQARRFKAAERQRLSTIAEIAGILGVLPEDLKLEELIKVSDGPSARSLGNCKKELNRLLDRLQQENHESKTMLAHCSELVNTSLAMLRNLLFPKPTYVRSGQIQGIAEGGMLISSKI